MNDPLGLQQLPKKIKIKIKSSQSLTFPPLSFLNLLI